MRVLFITDAESVKTGIPHCSGHLFWNIASRKVLVMAHFNSIAASDTFLRKVHAVKFPHIVQPGPIGSEIVASLPANCGVKAEMTAFQALVTLSTHTDSCKEDCSQHNSAFHPEAF